MIRISSLRLAFVLAVVVIGIAPTGVGDEPTPTAASTPTTATPPTPAPLPPADPEISDVADSVAATPTAVLESESVGPGGSDLDIVQADLARRIQSLAAAKIQPPAVFHRSG